MACDRVWEFPLTRHEKMQRVLMLFQEEVQRGESEIVDLKEENSDLRVENEKLLEQVAGLKDQLRDLKGSSEGLHDQLRDSKGPSVEADAAFQSPLKAYPFIEQVAVDTSEAIAFFDNATKKMATDTEQTVKLVKDFTSSLEDQALIKRVADVPAHATDALQAWQEESAKAFDTAFSESAKAIELVRDNCDGAVNAALTEKGRLWKLAQARTQMMQDQAQDFLSGGSWQEPKTNRRKKGTGEFFERKGIGPVRPMKDTRRSSSVQEHANDVTQKAKQAGESLSSSLWSWGQDIMTSVRLPADTLVTRQTLDFPLSDSIATPSQNERAAID